MFCLTGEYFHKNIYPLHPNTNKVLDEHINSKETKLLKQLKQSILMGVPWIKCDGSSAGSNVRAYTVANWKIYIFFMGFMKDRKEMV